MFPQDLVGLKPRRCDNCPKRMEQYLRDEESRVVHYLCHHCGSRGTYIPDLNGWSPGWPKEVTDQAVADGVLTAQRAIA